MRIDVHLEWGFSGSSQDYEGYTTLQWPPAPARLLSALMAAAGDRREFDEVLIAIENAPAPTIIASGSVASSQQVNTFTRKSPRPSMVMAKNLSNLVHTLASTAIPEHRTVSYIIDAEVDMEALSRLVRDISYFGSARDHATVTVTADSAVDVEGRAVWAPARWGRLLRTWKPGYVARNRTMHRFGHFTPMGFTEVRYAHASDATVRDFVALELFTTRDISQVYDLMDEVGMASAYPIVHRDKRVIGISVATPKQVRQLEHLAGVETSMTSLSDRGMTRYESASTRYVTYVPMPCDWPEDVAAEVARDSLTHTTGMTPDVEVFLTDDFSSPFSLWTVYATFPKPVTGVLPVGMDGFHHGYMRPISD